MESSTKILRRLLDERRVEWSATTGAAGTIWTHWDAFNGYRVHAMDNGDGTVEIFGEWDVTPAQAIAATLGATDAKPTQVESSETCHITDNGPWGYPYVCSECGASFDPDVNNGEFNYCPNCGRRIEQ